MIIRRFEKDKDSFDALVDLFSKGLGDTDKSFWDWKYLTPNGFDNQIMYIIEEASEIIAMMGFIPLEYTAPGGVAHKLVQMCDLVVSPGYRGRGLFYKIYDHAEEDLTCAGYEAFVSFPNHNSLHGFEKMGYRIEYMTNYPLGVNYKKLFLHKMGFGRVYKNTSGYDIDIKSDNFENECIIKAANNLLTQNSLRLNINPEYLSWRCEQYNSGRYKAVTVKDNGKIIAYFVLLITKGRRATAAKIVNFDIDMTYSDAIETIAIGVKSAIYSFADMIDFYGIWNESIKNRIINAFNVNERKITQGAEFIIKMLGDRKMFEYDLFINHIDSDL